MYRKEWRTWLWAVSKKCRWGGRSYLICCMLRRWPGWATRVIVAAKPEDLCNFLWKQYPYFTGAAAPTRGQCHSGRFCERFHKTFRISPWRIYYRLQDSKELCSIFLHPNVIPNCPKGLALQILLPR